MPQDRLFHPKGGHSVKLSMLTDFEFRVWYQYQLSSDDFGVMRHSAIALQADNDALAARPSRHVQRAFDRLFTVGLIKTFEHQGRTYCYQHDWQDWQRVEYPRATNEPPVPAHCVEGCTPLTQALFLRFPGGTSRRAPKDSPNESQMIPESVPNDLEKSATTRARAPAERLTANGLRLTANGSEGEPERKPREVARGGALAGSLPRDHLRHAYCGRKCVPDFLHAELIRALGGDEATADRRMRVWYEAIEAGLPDGPVSEEPLKFWRGAFARAYPPSAPTLGKQSTRLLEAVSRLSDTA